MKFKSFIWIFVFLSFCSFVSADFIDIAKDFSEKHNYSEDYNCKEYSIDLREIYNLNNINSTIMLGYNETEAHTWIRVYFNETYFDISPELGNIKKFPYKNIVTYQEYLEYNNEHLRDLKNIEREKEYKIENNFKECSNMNGKIILSKSSGISSSTNSMYPTIKDDSRIYLCKPEKNEVRLNDIIVFNVNKQKAIDLGYSVITRYEDRYFDYIRVIHRIIGVTKEGYITKGDNSNLDTWIIPFGDVEYKVYDIR